MGAAAAVLRDHTKMPVTTDQWRRSQLSFDVVAAVALNTVALLYGVMLQVIFRRDPPRAGSHGLERLLLLCHIATATTTFVNAAVFDPRLLMGNTCCGAKAGGCREKHATEESVSLVILIEAIFGYRPFLRWTCRHSSVM
jgi:hypothetical protein